MNIFKVAGLAAAATVLSTSMSLAATLNIEGLSNPDDNTATVELDYDSALSSISIEIENTSSFGTVTGFAFNVPTGVTGYSSFSVSGLGADNEYWDALFALDSIETPQPAGRFDAGAISDNDTTQEGGTSINGGFPNRGIEAGETATFSFVFTGTDLGTLTTDSFISLLSDPKNKNDGSYGFAVRFQETQVGSGSDVGVPDEGGIPPVPLPAAGWLLLAGLGGLAAYGRKKRWA